MYAKGKTEYPDSDSDDSENSYEDQLFEQARKKRELKEKQDSMAHEDSDTDTSTHSANNVPSEVPMFLKDCNIQVMDPITIKEKKNIGAYKMYEIIIHPQNAAKVSVFRRYSEFEWLYNTLKVLFYGHLVPNIPGKNVLAKIDREGDLFIESRRRQLEKFLRNSVHVEALQGSIELYEFLNMDTDKFKKYRSDYKIVIDTKYLKSTNWAKIYDKVNDLINREQ